MAADIIVRRKGVIVSEIFLPKKEEKVGNKGPVFINPHGGIPMRRRGATLWTGK